MGTLSRTVSWKPSQEQRRNRPGDFLGQSCIIPASQFTQARPELEVTAEGKLRTFPCQTSSPEDSGGLKAVQPQELPALLSLLPCPAPPTHLPHIQEAQLCPGQDWGPCLLLPSAHKLVHMEGSTLALCLISFSSPPGPHSRVCPHLFFVLPASVRYQLFQATFPNALQQGQW